MAYMVEDRVKYATKDAEKEKALKEVAEVTVREKGIATEVAKGKARELERAQALAEERATELETKLGEMKLKLPEAKSLISAIDKEVADLKAALEVSEDKFYDMGFADAENSCEPVVFQSRQYGFGEGWMVAVCTIGVPKDSPFRNPKHVPYPDPPVQNLACAEEEGSQSMGLWSKRLTLTLI